MKNVEDAKYKDDTRVKELIEWCNIHKGRTINLSRYLFDEEDGRIYPYKSGKMQITDAVWCSIQAAMPIIEESEPTIKTSVKGRIRHTQYDITARIYHRALKTLKNEETIKLFGQYVGLDLNLSNIKNPLYKDIIVNKYPDFKKSKIITPSSKIESHILKNKVDDWLLINDTLKKKLFNIVYPLMTNNKILRNKFTCFYNTSFIVNASIRGTVYKNVLSSMNVIDYLIINNDPLLDILSINSIDKAAKLIDLNYYKEYFTNINKSKNELLMAA